METIYGFGSESWVNDKSPLTQLTPKNKTGEARIHKSLD